MKKITKKILAVVLTLAMVMTLFVGCGKKESTYFKELKEMGQITNGTVTAEMGIVFDGEIGEETPELFKNADGKIAASIKIEAISESDTKGGIKLLAKVGQETEYAEITTFAIVDKKLYLTIDPLISFIKKVDAVTASQLEASLSQMGITGSISLDLEKVLQITGGEYPEVTDEMKKSILDAINALADGLDKNFNEIQGQKDDDFTLNINGDNAEKAVEGLVNFLKNDAEGIMKSLMTLCKEVYGDSADMATEMENMCQEVIDGLPEAVSELENSKNDIVKTIKDYNISINSSAKIDGKSGSRVGEFTLNTDEIKVDEDSINFNFKYEIKEGTPSVDEIVPKDASDITTLLVTMFTQFGAMDTEDFDIE